METYRKKFLKMVRYANDCMIADEILTNFSEYEHFKGDSRFDHWQNTMIFSKDLEEIVGSNEANKDDIAKLMHAYIKENKLQDPNNNEYVNCDEKLQKVVGKKKIKYTDLLKPVSHHMSY